MGHSKWSEIKRQKGAYDVLYTAEPDGPVWLLRVVGRPELVTAARSLDEADAIVRDLVATVDDRDAATITARRVI